MFDLEKSVRVWKKTLASNPGLEDGQRAELETSLRDEIADLIRQGVDPEEAFRRVSEEMGSPDDMGREFFKVYARSRFGPPSWTRTGFSPALLWNYAKITLRKIRRQKGYSLINIAGLAVGLGACLLMLLWVRHERSFDLFHVNRDSIYRMIKMTTAADSVMYDARTPYPLGPAVLSRVPEVQSFCRYQGFENTNLKYGDKMIMLPTYFGTADPSFFEIFTFPFLEGNPKTALDNPRSIVLTESTARTFFGEESPMGKMITYLGGWGDFEVTGIIRDLPEKSHLRFDAMVPIREMARGRHVEDDDWKPLFFYTYIQLVPHASPDSAASKIAAVLNENIPDLNAEVLLQPLKDVHLKSHFQWDLDNYRQGNQSDLTMFSLAALGVLLLALINFMNLSTARSINRAREVGLRKVSGARRTEIMGQFLGESLLMSSFGMGLALFLVASGLPYFNRLAGKSISFGEILQPQALLLLIGLILVTGLLAGSYPSFFLSAFQPSRVLKGGSLSSGRGQASLRKFLVAIQFTLTFILVMMTGVVDRQLKYVGEKNLGIDIKNVVNFLGPFEDFESLKSEFLVNPNILNITRSAPPQFEQRGRTDVVWEGKNPAEKITFFPLPVDHDYLETFRIDLVDGRFFSREFPSDKTESLVLNEAAVRTMGMDSPVGSRVTVGDRPYTVIGVVGDFHQSSLHRPIEPMILMDGENYQICARINPVNLNETLGFIETTIKRLEPRLSDYPIRITFLEQVVDGFYVSEQKVETILGLFAAVTLFTACLGLLGLASFLAEKRTKEIGIRKVLGAPVAGLVWLQTREFSTWVLISGLLAAPAAFYVSGWWLRTFTYRITPGIGLFLGTLGAILITALLAVGFQSVRAAKADPVKSLRHER